MRSVEDSELDNNKSHQKTGLHGRFIAVGLLGAAVYYSSLWFMVEQLGISVLVATSVAFILVTVENYLLHYSWTFSSTRSHVGTFPKFAFMNIVGFSMNLTIMAAGLHWFNVNYLLWQAIAIGAVVVWNFMISWYWIFRETQPKNIRQLH